MVVHIKEHCCKQWVELEELVELYVDIKVVPEAEPLVGQLPYQALKLGVPFDLIQVDMHLDFEAYNLDYYLAMELENLLIVRLDNH